MVALRASELPLSLWRRGKVRDVYEVDGDRLLIVATDRVSAFDVVMAEPVPHKGAVLTQLSSWWLRRLEGDVTHHLLTADAREIVHEVPELAPYRDMLAGRAMLCLRATVFPIECVIRGNLAGSAWKEYATTGTLAGESLPPGLAESAPLDPPVFSPATKAESGHDENITIERMRTIVGEDAAATLEAITRRVFRRGREIAAGRGIVIADTKLEFGRLADGRIALVDEVLTPDSSRFWPMDAVEPGRTPPSFDKQPLRDYLDGERRAGRWNGEAPPPALPEAVVAATSDRYLDAFRRLTGHSLTAAGPS